MIWYKYKHRHSYGDDKKWKFVYFPVTEVSKQEVRDFFERMVDDYGDSSSYRGIQWIKVSKLSQKEKLYQIEKLKSNIKSYRESIKELREVLKELK